MKKIIATVLILFAGILSFAQKQNSNKQDDLLFMLRQKEHINQAIKTIHQLESEKTTLRPGKIVIIVCGEAVTSLTTDDAKDWVEKLKGHRNVSLMACGLSLDKFNKKREDLVPGVAYTFNGFIKAFELQKQGYLSVEL